MNNKILFGIALAAVTIAIGVLSSGEIVEAVKPPTEVIVTNDNANPIPVSVAVSPVCPADKVQHWQTVQFESAIDFIELVSDTNPTLPPNTGFWINLRTNSEDIFDTNTLLLNTLEEMGYHMRNINDGTEFPPDQNFQTVSLQIQDPTKSSVICAD